jgi:phosphoribosylanthranilate isomerase
MSSAPSFRVKVCGLTRIVDVDLAVAAGADAIGVVSYPTSPRHAEPTLAAALLGRRPRGVRGVLVAVDIDPCELAQRASACGADLVQLCGSERPQDFVGFPFPVLRRLAVDDHASHEQRIWATVAAGFVLDHPSAPGGTGHGVDPTLAAELCRVYPCALAGGLDGDVVAARIVATGAYAVDASSRLELAPGVKDPTRVRAFVRAALAALAEKAIGT